VRLFGRVAALPLGADIGRDVVSVVRVTPSRGGLTARETATRAVPPANDSELDLKIAETIRRVLDGLATRERRCVLAAPASDLVHRIFRVPPGMGRREAERSAALEVDMLVPWTAAERLIALDAIPGRDGEMLLSVARLDTVARLVAIARAGGLKPVAVDVPICAWRRAVPDADALLDATRERAELVIFGDAAGTTHAFPPRLVDDRLATLVRAALVEARRDGVADVRRLAILAAEERFAALEACLRDDGYAIVPVTCGAVRAPHWAYAYGLATWSVPPAGARGS
jgi:hypothetical protein